MSVMFWPIFITLQPTWEEDSIHQYLEGAAHQMQAQHHDLEQLYIIFSPEGTHLPQASLDSLLLTKSASCQEVA